MGTYFYVPLSAIADPQSGEFIKDHWWAYHPARGVLFWTHRHRPPPVGFAEGDLKPQCNRDQRVSEMVIKRLHEPPIQPLLVPAAYLACVPKFAIRALEEKNVQDH